jgi:hypothetical protein
VLTVKKSLGHKRIENTVKCIGMIKFGSDDYQTTTATTPEEIGELGTAGWTKYDEMTFNGVQMHFYRKPKRFGNCV